MIRRILNFLFDDTNPLSVARLMVRGLNWLMIGVVVGRLVMFVTRIAAAIRGKVPLGDYRLIEATVNLGTLAMPRPAVIGIRNVSATSQRKLNIYK